MAKRNKHKKALAASTKKENHQTIHHENVLGPVTEAQVGIQEYAKKGKQFSAHLKQCNSDFQVGSCYFCTKILLSFNIQYTRFMKLAWMGRLFI
jgi:hypothetical protein